MFPNVYQLLQAAPAVVAIVGQKVGRHGSMPQDESAPYITWFVVVDDPHNTLSEVPRSDANTVQLDCWSMDDAEAVALARAVRAHLDANGHHNRVVIDLREPDTKLYRVGIQADLITQR